MNQYQIGCRARHLRLLFFIDDQYSYKQLFSLIDTNQRYWGGRYNPIVPVVQNTIAPNYLELIGHYDPDYIFYSPGIDVEALKKLRLFNPAAYHAFEEYGSDIEGVYSLRLISQLEPKSNVLMSNGLGNFESPLLEFYKINFGLQSSSYVGDSEIVREYNQIEVTKENFANLNQIIHTEKPILQAHLAKRHINTVVLRSKTHSSYNSFELVVAKDNESILDML